MALIVTVDAPHFNAGVTLENCRVSRGAPVLRYMRGWTLSDILRYAEHKGWKVTVDDERRPPSSSR